MIRQAYQTSIQIRAVAIEPSAMALDLPKEAYNNQMEFKDVSGLYSSSDIERLTLPIIDPRLVYWI